MGTSRASARWSLRRRSITSEGRNSSTSFPATVDSRSWRSPCRSQSSPLGSRMGGDSSWNGCAPGRSRRGRHPLLHAGPLRSGVGAGGRRRVDHGSLARPRYRAGLQPRRTPGRRPAPLAFRGRAVGSGDGGIPRRPQRLLREALPAHLHQRAGLPAHAPRGPAAARAAPRLLWRMSARPVQPLPVLVAGSRGHLGSALIPLLESRGHRIRRLVRAPRPAGPDQVAWDPAAGAIDAAALEGIDAAINLIGERIAAVRWTRAKKTRLYTSRIVGTRLLAETLARPPPPPRVFLSASAVRYFGRR